ncbi:MAG: hypothetical protein V1871_03420 [Planctomycetota bacterium]
METNIIQNSEQERTENLTSLAYLLKLFLNYKRAKRKEKIYAWLIICGATILGIALFYLLIVKWDVVITNNQAQVKFVVYSGDNVQNTADNVAGIIYRVSKKYNKIHKVTLSLYRIHSKVHTTVYMGNITEDAIEPRKYKDLASYINARRDFLITRISSLQYADSLKDSIRNLPGE